MKKIKIKVNETLKDACGVVERYARSIGRDCQIVFIDDGVEVAPLSWSGSVNEADLYSALTEARMSSEE